MEQRDALTVVIGTDPGRVRGRNEDYVRHDQALGAVVLADGMGGHRSGQVASRLAVDTVMAELRERLPGPAPSGTDEPTAEAPVTEVLRAAITHANEVVYRTSQSEPQYYGMGTTLVLALFRPGHVTIAHVGDSRAYRLREDVLETITVDHTLLQELVDRGLYSPEEAERTLNKNIVTRALGIEADVKVDVQEHAAQPGDLYVLCSDGLNDMVADRDIHLTLKEHLADLDTAPERLIALANDNGGRDNITVALARLADTPAEERA